MHALVQYVKMEEQFFTTATVRIVFLYTYFEREYIQNA